MNKEELSKLREEIGHYGYGYDMEDLVPFGNPAYTIGIPNSLPDEAKFRIHASLNTVSLGRSSIDYQVKELKRLGVKYRRDKELDRFYDSIQTFKYFAEQTSKKISDLEPETVPANKLLAETCLVRLHATTKAAAFLMLNGYYFETYSILRIILEQIAYAYVIYEQSIEFAQKCQPQKCISILSRHFSPAGELYGHLSERAHIRFQQTQHFFVRDEQNGRFADHQIVMQTTRNRYENLAIGFKILDLYDIVSESLLRKYFKKFESWKRTKTGLVIKKNRIRAKYVQKMIRENRRYLALRESDAAAV
jgi:hypothetical protein